MKKPSVQVILLLFIVAVTAVGLTELRHLVFTNNDENIFPIVNESTTHSQYAGQETRGIKSLSQEDIEGLQSGAGTPLGGLAKLAELNGYPGPRHVLDANEAGKFDISPEQKVAIQKLYDEMQPQAVGLGLQLIATEKNLNDAFAKTNISEEILKNELSESARIYGELRFVHLKYHLTMTSILNSEQVAAYNTLRGYATNPCTNTPEGHDPEMWKKHNNCQ